jgi:FMN phosphatase YigB (HAD superfamily)
MFRTNIARHDFEYLKAMLSDWSLFDGEYTSFEAGKIKPELGYYKYVLESLDLSDPNSAIFVDDKVTSVSAAQSFGIQGIVFESAGALMRQLRNRLFDPVMRGRQYMAANAQNHHSQIENGLKVRDVFSQFLIHKELQDVSH